MYVQRMATPSRSGAPINKEAMSKLDAQLTCAICLERYKDPRILPCHHVYCKDCIDGILPDAVERKEIRQHNTVKCPSCRSPIQLDPNTGSGSLPCAFFVNNLLEIRKLTQKTSEPRPVCRAHNKPKDVYCETCEEFLCFKCSIAHCRSNQDHQCDRADDLFEKHMQLIKGSLKSLDERIDAVEQTLAIFDTTEKQIREQEEAVKKEIDEAVQQHMDRLQELMHGLQQSRKALYDQVETATRQKLQLHSLERVEVETIFAQLKSCKEFVEEELRSRSQHQIQTARRKLVQHITDSYSTVKVSEIQPGQVANTRFVCVNELPVAYSNVDLGGVDSIQNYQSIRDLFSVDIPQHVLVGQTTDIFISLPSISLPAELLSCRLLYGSSESELVDYQDFVAVLIEDGHFKVTLNPRKTGPHKLSVYIRVGDGMVMEIDGSPFNICIVSLSELRDQTLEVFAKGLQHPCGVAVTDDGQHVVVTEVNRHCVAVLSSTSREVINRFGQHGNGPGKFNYPTDVVVSADHHVFIRDYNGIQKFTIGGAFVARFAAPGGFGIGFLSNGSVLTCSADKRKIYQITPDLQTFDYFIAQLPGEACTLAVRTDGVVYVLTSDKRIHKFTAKGRPFGSFGSAGYQPDLLQKPYEMCIDSSNLLHVTDKLCIQTFTSDGDCIAKFGVHHTKLRGIAASKTEDLYICKANGEVLVSSIRQD